MNMEGSKFLALACLFQLSLAVIGGCRNLIYGQVINVATMAWLGEKEEGG